MSFSPVTTPSTLHVLENDPASAIGIVAPTDMDTLSTDLTVTIDVVPTNGTVTMADGVTVVSANDVLSTTELAGLQFTPTPGVFHQSSVLSYTVSDPEGNSTAGSATLAISAVGNPVTTPATLSVAENAAATNIGIAAPTDPNYDVIDLVATVGMLPGDGTVTLADGTPVALADPLTVAQLTALQFTPTAGHFDASSAFAYTVTDPDGNSASGSATLAIGPALGNPVVTPVTLAVAENATATNIGIAVPSDPNYTVAQLLITAGDLPEDGMVTLADGSAVVSGAVLSGDDLAGLQFTPAHGQFDQTSSFTYTVADPSGNSSTGTATLAIGPALGNPVVTPVTLAVAENAAATNIGIAVPSDPNYTVAQLLITAGDLPEDGTVTLADGSAVVSGAVLSGDDLAGLQFTPAHGQFDQTSSFTYTVADPSGNSSTGTATLAIGPALGNPVVTPVTLAVAENATATNIGIAVPSDPNYTVAQLHITAGDLPEDGTVTLADGSAVVSGAVLSGDDLAGLQFTPAHGQFDQTSSFTYTVADPSGNSSTGTATLAIGPALGNPVVTPATLAVAENATATNIGIAVPSDPNYTVDQLHITAGDLPEDGMVTLADGSAVVSGAVLSGDDLAGLQFTPAHGQFDQTSSFTYTVADPSGNSSTGTATLAIGPALGNPVVTPVTLGVAENATATNIGIALPSDPNYTVDQLHITAGDLPEDGMVTLADGSAVVSGAVLSGDDLAGLQFTPAHGQFDQTSSFTYTVADPSGNSSTGTATLAIGPALGNPVVTPATLAVAENATATNIGVAVPSDPNYTVDQLHITAGDLPEDGMVTLADGSAVVSGAVLSGDDLAGLQFTPAHGQFDQTSSFTYTVADPSGNSSTGTATLAIGPALGNPVVTPVTLGVAENATATNIGIALPSDPNYTVDQLHITAGDLPEDGMVTLADGSAVVSGAVLSGDDLAGLQFTPAHGQFDQTSSFTYTVADPSGNSSTGTATLAIGPALGNPVVTPATLAVAENATATNIGIAVPSDPNYTVDQLLITAGDLPEDGTVTLADGSAVVSGAVLSGDDLAGLQFTPAHGQFDQTSSFTYTVADPSGNSSTGTATLAIGPALGNPVVTPVTLAVAENATATNIGIAVPSDPNYTVAQLHITAGDLPEDGTVTLADGSAVVSGAVLSGDDLAGLQFTPAHGQFDQTSSFTYTVADPSGNSSTGTATLAIGPALGNPVVTPATLAVAENATATNIGIAVPSDPNYTVDQLHITAGDLPEDGMVTLADGSAVVSGAVLSGDDLAGLQFTPAHGQFDQTSSFTYTVADPSGNSSTGTATLAIGPALGNPVVTPVTLGVAENATATNIGIALPSDPNYTVDQLHITAGDLPEDGMVTLADGSAVVSGAVLSGDDLAGLQFTPAHGQFDQTSSFTYTVADPSGNSSTGTATLAIGPALGNPVVTPATLAVAENATATNIGVAVPSDPNYTVDQLHITAGDLPEDGMVTLADGSAVVSGAVLSGDDLAGLQFTPAHGQFDQTSSFTYTVADPSGNSSTGTATLAIGPALGNPVVTPVTLGVAENATATNIGIAVPSDPNYTVDQLHITAGDLPEDGMVTLADGSAVVSGAVLSGDDLAGLQFTPAHGQFDQTSSFTYTVADPSGNSSTGTATLAIGPSLDVDPVSGAALPVIDPTLDGKFKITNVDAARSGGNDGTTYDGPVSYLHNQFIWSGSESVAIKADVPDVFLHGGSAGDALQVTGGHNVLDGGGGSNFLVGADGSNGGQDVFFVDARNSEVTWSTVVNFHRGDEVTLWGFQQGVSTMDWVARDGAAGYEGATLHSKVAASDTGITASVTFANVSREDAATKFTMDTGSVDGNSYLHISYTG